MKYLSLTLFLLLAGFFSFSAKAACPGLNVAFTPSSTLVCGTGPATITFINGSSGTGATTATYTWYRNGTLFSTTTGLTAPASSTVSAAGNYTFTLIATDNNVPCSDTVTVVVSVVPAPSSSFGFSSNNQCAGTTVYFANTSTGTFSGTTYLWNFGDGQTSTAASPGHVFAAGGTYNVTLTMSNGAGCTSSTTQQVTAQAIPNISISGDDGDGNITNCLLPIDTMTQETVIFSNATTGAVSYTWNFGDGTPAYTTTSNAAISHQYTAYGTFTVTMTATHANGCTASQTLTVVFEKYVSTSFSVPITQMSGCAPHNVLPVNGSVNANNYVWNFGDGTPNVTTTNFAAPPHTYTANGNYTITLTASNSCNTAVSTVSPIVIVAKPNAQFNTSLPGNLGCAPQGVSFTNTSQFVAPANNYQWSFGNGNTATNVVNPAGQVYGVGVFTVQMIAGNGCGTDTAIQVLTIDTLPVAAITVNPVEGCTPLTVTTTNQSTGQSLSYAWYIDGVLSYTTQNIPPLTFTAPPGNNAVTHTVRLVVSNHCGWDDTIVPVIVHPAVQTTITPLTATICEGDSLVFSQTTYGDSLLYSWDFGNGITSNIASPGYVAYDSAGTYTVQLAVAGYCGVDTAYSTVTVQPVPVADFTFSPDSLCVGEALSITNLSTPGSTVSWNFGAGATPVSSTSFTPGPVIYSTPGNSIITLSVNLAGCVASTTDSILINPVPVSSFTLTPAQGCTPLTVTFTNNGTTANGESFQWDTGNGFTSVAVTPPAQTYTAGATDTTYLISLEAENSFGCSDTSQQSVLVHARPIAAFLPTTDTVCATYNISFTNLSTGAVSYSWDFGDGTPVSTSVNPVHSYASTGTFQVTLGVTNAFGCTDTAYGSVFVDPVPVASFAASIECVGDSTIFTDSSAGAASWSWNFGDGSPASSLSSPAHLYSNAGTYTVQLTATNLAGCAHTFTQNVTVNTVPVASISNTSTCIGQPTIFTSNNSGTPTGWQWDFGDGTGSSVLTNPSYTYSDTGSFPVVLIVTAGTGCADTTSLQVSVSPKPTAAFAVTPACTNDSTLFVSTSSGGGDVFTWLFGDGTSNTANDTITSHIYSTSGTYQVSLIAGYSASGCADTLTIPVQSYPRTQPAFTTNTPCLGQDVQFSDISTGTPINWQYDFGDGNSSIQSNPQHSYSAAGTYQVTLTTANTFGCTDSITQSVTVNPLPVALFEADTVCLNAATTFTDLSTSAVQWQWDFDDGNTMVGVASPQHTFAADGTYPVSLVVSNNFGCTDTFTLNTVVHPNPVAAFTADTACALLSTSFTDLSSGAVTWQWTFGDGAAQSSTQNPVYLYPGDSTYQAELIVTNTFGCTDTALSSVIVLPRPVAGYSFNVVCARDVVQFTDTSLNAPTIWFWDFGDGTTGSSLQHPTHVYPTGGSYTLTLIAGNPSGCFDTISGVVDVHTVPTPAFEADTVCFGNITAFTDLSVDSVPIVSWAWNFGDGNNSFTQNPSYIYLAPGVYYASLQVTNSNGCDSMVTLPVYVNAQPVAGFISDTVCVGSATTFTDTSTGTATSWLWDFGDGTTSTTGPVVNHTYSAAGSYLVLLTVTGGANCSDQTFAVAQVSSVVQAAIQAPDSACTQEMIQFTDVSSSISGSITGFAWDFGDGNSSAQQNPQHTYASAGTYTVTLQVTSSGGCVSTDSVTVVVSPLPVPAFNVQDVCEAQEAIFTDQTAGTVQTWLWDFGDGTTSSQANPTHIYSLPGAFSVTLTVASAEGCSGTASQQITVFPKPLASFSSDTVCWGQPTTLLNNSTVGTGSTLTTHLWDFGDGTSANGLNQQHTFTQYNDSFYVSLIVMSDRGCRDTVTQLVQTFPVAEFDFAPILTSGCAPFTAQFADASTVPGGSIVNWLWDFGDGSMGFGQSPQHVYTEPGDYFVSITITSTHGCSFEQELLYPVKVYPKPVAEFYTTPDDISVFLPEVQFHDFSQGASYWFWNFGDSSTSSDLEPVHTYTDSGTYMASLIVLNQWGCSDTVYHPVTVKGEYTIFFPSAFSPNGDGRNETFNGQGSGITEYRMYVFDRWGVRIFETGSTDNGWDGRANGQDAPQDVYVYRAVITDVFGKKHELEGHFTLIR